MDAVDEALKHIQKTSEAYKAVEVGKKNIGKPCNKIIAKYKDLSPVHSLNNLAIVVWAFLSFQDSFDEAVGEAVSAGWDTDCNGATVGGLFGLANGEIPSKWTNPWRGKVNTTISGIGELSLENLIQRTENLQENISSQLKKT